MFRDPRLSRMATLLGSIGIGMRAGTIDVPTLFPGSLISCGSLIIDESRLIAPVDALQEAAHIALSPPERRSLDSWYLKSATIAHVAESTSAFHYSRYGRWRSTSRTHPYGA